MSNIIPSLKNGFILLATLAPLLLGFFLVMSSIIDGSVRGIVYLGGVLICYLVYWILTISFSTPAQPVRPNDCTFINWGWAPPSLIDMFASNTMFLMFTSVYIIMPMILADQINIGMIVILGILYIIEAITRVVRGCIGPLNIFLGTLLGGLLGAGYASAFYYTQNGNLLYFNEIISNNQVCKRSLKQKFKCAIYKNGELVKNL